MSDSTFVGREIELKLLTQILIDGGKQDGQVVFIEGEAGTGKSLLIQTFQEEAGKRPNADKVHFLTGYCYEDTGGQNAYQPFLEILEKLVSPSRKTEELSKLFLTILKETGTDWLNMFPGIGPAITASIKTATIAGQWFFSASNKQANQSENLSNQYAQVISKIATKYSPLVLVIEDSHWIDDASCRLLLRLAHKIKSQAIIIIITMRASYLVNGHPFLKVRNELLGKNLARIIKLSGLEKAEIESYIALRFGEMLNPKLAEWLVHLSKGHPLFVTQYLSLLEQTKVIYKNESGKFWLDGEIKFVADEWEINGPLAKVVMPKSIDALLEQRIQRLIEEDREMLQLGAVQGEYFMSAILAEIMKSDEVDILRRLRKVVEQHRLISVFTGESTDTSLSGVYVFEHALLQQAFYNKLSPRERVLYHRNIAEQIETLFKQREFMPRKLLLEIAHHYNQGGLHLRAANYYKLAAKSLLADGAYVEAAEISKRALENIRQVAAEDREHAEIIEIFFTATRWIELANETNEAEVNKLFEEGDNAAIRTGDKALQARMKYLRGMQIGRRGNLIAWLKLLEEALVLMQEAGDPTGEFFIMSQLGQEMRSIDFEKGFNLQQEAYNLFNEKVNINQALPSPELKHQFHIIQNLLGVAKFDHGDYGEALHLLQTSIAEFQKLNLKHAIVEGGNYLAQLYLAMGMFEEAEATLTEALDIVKNEGISYVYNGYNLSLLGKVYLEWGKIDDAIGPMLQGWEESQAAPAKVLSSLIRNYYAELLMHQDYRGHDLSKADELLQINIRESTESSYHRSAITAISLRSILALSRGNIDLAVKYSEDAVNYLEKFGTLPALRTEEIFYNHYNVMKAAGKEIDGNRYLKRAYDVLQKKSNSIINEVHRKSYLERVHLSRNIISAIFSPNI